MKYAVKVLISLLLIMMCHHDGFAQTYIREYEWRDNINEALISAKVPKKLRTNSPFWGVPVPQTATGPASAHGYVPASASASTSAHGYAIARGAIAEASDVCEEFTYYQPDTTRVPRWICWNLDLATMGENRYKYEKLFPSDIAVPCLDVIRCAVLECYKWAWRKPYGNTCVVLMPLYNNRSRIGRAGAVCPANVVCPADVVGRAGAAGPADAVGRANVVGPTDAVGIIEKMLPYAYIVAVCKQERLKVPMPLGFTSTAFMIPFDAQGKNIYDYSISVNAAEAHSRYDLFSKLPSSVQEQVEELTDYEILCPFQETDQSILDQFMPELERGDLADDPMREVD